MSHHNVRFGCPIKFLAAAAAAAIFTTIPSILNRSSIDIHEQTAIKTWNTRTKKILNWKKKTTAATITTKNWKKSKICIDVSIKCSINFYIYRKWKGNGSDKANRKTNKPKSDWTKCVRHRRPLLAWVTLPQHQGLTCVYFFAVAATIISRCLLQSFKAFISLTSLFTSTQSIPF